MYLYELVSYWYMVKVKLPVVDEDLIFMARHSFLFINGQPWVKRRDPTFDVTMGAYDGAEVAEFVGLFILHKLSSIMNISDFALYRDDGICAITGTKRAVDKTRKKIEKRYFLISGFKLRYQQQDLPNQ